MKPLLTFGILAALSIIFIYTVVFVFYLTEVGDGDDSQEPGDD